MKDIKISKQINTDCIEIHTGKLANLVKSKNNYSKELKELNNVHLMRKNLE